MAAADTTTTTNERARARRPVILLAVACATGALLSAAPGHGNNAPIATALPRGFDVVTGAGSTAVLSLRARGRNRSSLVVRGDGESSVCVVAAGGVAGSSSVRLVVTRRRDGVRLFAGRLGALRPLSLGRLPRQYDERLVFHALGRSSERAAVVFGWGRSTTPASRCA